MTDGLYHVDRKGDLRNKDEIHLQHNSPQHEILHEMFPDGMSKFGYNATFRKTDGIASIEAFLELYRQLEYPNKPSRLDSVYACQTVEDAKRFAKKYIDNTDNDQVIIWRIENKGVRHQGDMKHLIGGVPNLRRGIEAAESYWSGQASENPHWELLLDPPVGLLGEEKRL